MKIPAHVNLEDFVDFVGEQESQFLTQPSDHVADLLRRHANGPAVYGDQLPWNKTADEFRLRPGEVTVWAGINGHGKSQLTGQVVAWLLPRRKVCLASMEMKPEATLDRMCRQTSGQRLYGKEYAEKFCKWADQRLVIYDQLDTVPAERILGLVNWAAGKVGCSHVVIDSLMKCGMGKDDYEGQTRFIDKLCWAAKRWNCHIHLIHHTRKGQREAERPDKFDVRGAGEIVDMVDNLIIVWRNKSKEDKRNKGDAGDPSEPDCVMAVAKQRHGEVERAYGLWFDAASQQFTTQSASGPMRWEGFRDD